MISLGEDGVYYGIPAEMTAKNLIVARPSWQA